VLNDALKEEQTTQKKSAGTEEKRHIGTGTTKGVGTSDAISQDAANKKLGEKAGFLPRVAQPPEEERIARVPTEGARVVTPQTRSPILRPWKKARLKQD